MRINVAKIDRKNYFLGAMVLGLALCADSIVALANIQNILTAAFSFLELFWFMVTLFYLWVFMCQRVSLLLPTLYAVYYLFGWFYGSYLLTIQIQPTLILPVWYKIFAGVFGVGYFLYALYFYREQKLKN